MSAAALGHNNPPSAIDSVFSAAKDLSNWMAENPVIQQQEKAKQAKLLCDRSTVALEELEAERDASVRPLNTQVKGINEQYKVPKETLTRVVSELKSRLQGFIEQEEAKRKAEAAEKAQLAFEAEKKAREAWEREQEALANASVGEIDVDVAKVTTDAINAFSEYETSVREAKVAEKDAHVKLGGGFGRAMSLKTKETLILDNALKAVEVIGVTDKIREAILSAARDYRRLNNRLPDGVSSITEKVL